MPKKELIDITVEKLAETEKAWRVFDGTRTEWVPKSQCELESDGKNNFILTCPEWLAKEKGFI